MSSPTSLDLATRHLTAFRSYSDLTDDMDATGYFPTIRAERKAVGKLAPEALSLRLALVQSGRRVFPAFGSYPTERQAIAEAARRIYEVRP